MYDVLGNPRMFSYGKIGHAYVKRFIRIRNCSLLRRILQKLLYYIRYK